MSEVARLLTVLVLGNHAERAAVLHEAILLRQADGTVQEGRRHVLDIFSRSEPGTSYRIVATQATSLRVALHIPGIPGHLAFTLHGERVGEQLIAVHVEI